MKTKVPRISFVLGITIGIWLIFLVLVHGVLDPITGHLHVKVLEMEADRANGKEMSRQELESWLSKVRLEFPTNKYEAEMNYDDDPTKWSVLLIPEKKRTYVIHRPLWSRILFLEFSKMEYPVFEISGSKSKTNGTPH